MNTTIEISAKPAERGLAMRLKLYGGASGWVHEASCDDQFMLCEVCGRAKNTKYEMLSEADGHTMARFHEKCLLRFLLENCDAEMR